MSKPRHVGIIMDGNGRWATQRGLPKIMGHRAGAKNVVKITEACARNGVSALTLYAFSSENWNRPRAEVDALMSLLQENLKNNLDKLISNNLRFNVIGRRVELSSALNDEIERAKNATSANTGMVLTLAVNYGGRQEIVDAACAFCRESGKKDASDIVLAEADFEKFLYTKNLPDLDIIIRTSGEMRLSNFLLWQAAYSEFYVTDVLWPDFNIRELEKALDEFSKRARRFGG
ncbi:MAG: isoprenyl transferase [Candidatus Omnitrophica bacterium]|nr:isoprenyl transferase [Candidatus Omnitrophota bacterium]MBU1127675.1 isoprenyl transferase [Candidatus Omnitrophota bacterium]MBU1784704.1 isoprenyl transferase [Candidatus Omnitrophota bacterium]MBU1851464.1 isoprenyl transferase [Candidatus Omnitrophota bacterium]